MDIPIAKWTSRSRFKQDMQLFLASVDRCRSMTWMIIAAGFITTVINMGILMSLGALFVPISKKFGTSRPATAFVQSLLIGMLGFSAVIGVLIKRYGLFKIALAGTMLTSIGFGCAFFASEILHLYICVSGIGGTGIATMFMISNVAIGYVTEGRSQAIALAINNSCMGLGAVSFPHLLNYLDEHYDTNGTFLILAGICFNNIGIALLLCFIEKDALKLNDEAKVNTDHTNNDKTFGYITSLISRVKAHLLNIFSVPYTLTIISTMFMMASLDSYVILFVDIFIWKAFTESQGITSIVPYLIANTVAGLLVALLKTFKPINTFAIAIGFCVTGCIGLAIIYVASSVVLAYVGSFVLGLNDGGSIAVSALLAAELVSAEYFSTAYGILLTGYALCSVFMGPACGALRDVTNSYVSVLWLIGGVQLGTMFLYLTAWLVHRRRTDHVHTISGSTVSC